MSELLSIKHKKFTDEMKNNYENEESITSVNIFDTFVRALSKDTNVLSEEKLKGLVFRQFKSYGNFDETMIEVAQSVSSIKQSTQDAISAIDKKDTNALKHAYEQLKDYEKRIQKLEEDIYTDEVTGIYNRKYLLNHELDKDGKFKEDGKLIHISIDNFSQINKDHGHEAGDSVLKFVSKICQKNLKSMGVHLIRYLGVQLIVVSKQNVSKKAVSVCTETVDMILSKKFKTHNGEILNIELKLVEEDVKKGQDFQKVYEDL